MFNDVRRCTIHEDGDGVHYAIKTLRDPMPAPPQGMECMMVFFVILERRATGLSELSPTQVCLEHARSERTAELERLLFGANKPNIVNSAPEYSMSFATVDADRHHTTAGPDLVAILERHAEAAIARLPAFDDDLGDVRRAVADELAKGETAIGGVAKRLGTTSRTLQRRLESENTTYQVLLDEVRYAMATRYLDDARLSIAEVALALGFADQSAFSKAFQRWSGTTPGAYRRTGAHQQMGV